MKSLGIIQNIWRRKLVGFGKYQIVEPKNVSSMRFVPDHIIKPSYAFDGESILTPNNIDIKSSEEIYALTNSCRLAKKLLNSLGDLVKVGVTTDEIDEFIHNECIKEGAYPSPLNYKAFPKSICTSVNNVACHGIPDDRALVDGDIINVDITVYFENHHGDCSKTFLVGNVDEQGKELVAVTMECLDRGISICGPHVPFKEIGSVIEDHAVKSGYTIVPAFAGHGIGEYFHGPPDIFHAKNTYPGRMQPGMAFTIEPVLSSGGPMVEILEDNWTAITVDNARTAQFEHTILITEDGCEILTK